ncbi:MAG: hypothetical protein ACI9U2_001281 [Bradymonadia bacterium]|jgi:hypothetical protein
MEYGFDDRARPAHDSRTYQPREDALGDAALPAITDCYERADWLIRVVLGLRGPGGATL